MIAAKMTGVRSIQEMDNTEPLQNFRAIDQFRDIGVMEIYLFHRQAFALNLS